MEGYWKRNGKKILLGIATVATVALGTAYYLRVREEGISERGDVEEERERKEIDRTIGGTSSSKEDVEFQETRRKKDALEDENVKQHFRSIQKISDQTTLPSILPQLRQQMLALVDVDVLAERLQRARRGEMEMTKEEKMRTWHEIKVLSFVRTLASVWAVCLLDLLLRVQLNILGRRLYLDTALGEDRNAPGLPEPLTQLVQHQYLAHADYFPKKGVEILVRKMRPVVERVVGHVGLQHPTGMGELVEYVSTMSSAFCESMNPSEWLGMLFPPPLPEDKEIRPVGAEPLSSDAAMLEAMVSETRNILGGREFASLMLPMAREASGMILAHLPHALGGPDHPTLPFVRVVPAVAGITSLFLDHPKACTESLAELPMVQDFCVSVYTATGPVSPPWPTVHTSNLS